jgi:hypothetical protein
MSGFGQYVWKDQKSYEGYWKQGMMHGKGNMTWANSIFLNVLSIRD